MEVEALEWRRTVFSVSPAFHRTCPESISGQFM